MKYKSKPEKIIHNILGETLPNDYVVLTQYRIDECRSKIPLPFDFAIIGKDKQLKLLIEYDGEQHFQPVSFTGYDYVPKNRLREIQMRDKIKTDYCQKNGINLVRISYIELNCAEDILKNAIKEVIQNEI